MNIKEVIGSLTEDEYGAVCAVMHYINSKNISAGVAEVNKEIFKRAEEFIDGNETFDVIYLQTRGAIKNWDHDKALNIIDQHIKVPLVTCEDFMMPYAVLGVTQVSKEQGMWAAETAKRILQGTKPSDIPTAKNQMTTVWLNTRLAEKIDFIPDKAFLSKARIVD